MILETGVGTSSFEPASSASAPPASQPRRRRYRPGAPEDVQFPAAPMLDMAFQLLAFFLITFRAPSAETHLELNLPATPVALPTAPRGEARPGRLGTSILTWKTTCWYAPRPTTWAT